MRGSILNYWSSSFMPLQCTLWLIFHGRWDLNCKTIYHWYIINVFFIFANFLCLFINIFVLILKKSMYFLQRLYLSEPGQEHVWFVFTLEISRNKYKKKGNERQDYVLLLVYIIKKCQGKTQRPIRRVTYRGSHFSLLTRKSSWSWWSLCKQVSHLNLCLHHPRKPHSTHWFCFS